MLTDGEEIELDSTLERILSLIPRKEDGKFVHGAFKQFGESIGYDGGEIVTMWIKGSSESYKKKLHEIADKYDVSVEWLQGYTDVKEKPTAGAVGMSPTTQEIVKCLDGVDEATLKRILEVVKLFVESKK